MRHAIQAASVAAVFVFASLGAASADPIQDPALFEAMGLTNTCSANCGSVSLATDPLSGITTVRYAFNSTIAAVVAGDVKVTEFGSSTVGDLLRFENIGGVADLFLFSGDGTGGNPYPADVGLPSSFQSNTATIAENASGVTSLYTPMSSQPGFCLTVTGAPCTTGVAYQLTSPDAVPEPITLSLFSAGIGGLAFIRRKRKKA